MTRILAVMRHDYELDHDGMRINKHVTVRGVVFRGWGQHRKYRFEGDDDDDDIDNDDYMGEDDDDGDDDGTDDDGDNDNND